MFSNCQNSTHSRKSIRLLMKKSWIIHYNFDISHSYSLSLNDVYIPNGMFHTYAPSALQLSYPLMSTILNEQRCVILSYTLTGSVQYIWSKMSLWSTEKVKTFCFYNFVTLFFASSKINT